METHYLIPADEFCLKHNIEISFVKSLEQSGLIEITTVKNRRLLSSREIGKLERFRRLYFDLDINLEGIETITHLLTRIEHMQGEINRLKNRLRFYEE